MNLRLTLVSASRIVRQIVADRRSMALILVVPAALLVLLYFIYYDNSLVFNRIAPAISTILPLMMMFIVASVTMQRERANGTLERLWTTPLHRADLIGGYALAFGLLAMIQATILVTVLNWPLNVDSEAPWWASVFLAGVTGVTGMALGLLGSAFAQTEFQAVQLMPVLIAPQILLCGILSPRENMPWALSKISEIFPLSYAVDAMTTLNTTGIGNEVIKNTAICFSFGIVFLAIAALTIPRKTK